MTKSIETNGNLVKRLLDCVKKNSMIRYREMVLAEGFVAQEIVENCLTSIGGKCNAGVERSTVRS